MGISHTVSCKLTSSREQLQKHTRLTRYVEILCRVLMKQLASTPQYTRRHSRVTRISSFAPHLRPPLLRLPLLQPALDIRIPRRMGHRTRLTSNTQVSPSHVTLLIFTCVQIQGISDDSDSLRRASTCQPS